MHLRQARARKFCQTISTILTCEERQAQNSRSSSLTFEQLPEFRRVYIEVSYARLHV